MTITEALEKIDKLEKHIALLERQFTCHKCPDKGDCRCAWDGYNIGGDCLVK